MSDREDRKSPHLGARSALAAVSVLFCAGPPAAADIEVYLDVTEWEAAVGEQNVVVDDFSSFPDPALDIPEGESFDVGLFDVFYATAAGIDNPSIDVGDGPTPRLRLRSDSTGDDALTTLEFHFDPAVVGFGGAWDSVDTSDEITMIVDGVPIDLSDSLADSAEMGFVGFTATTAVSTIEWSWSGDAFFTVSSVSVVFAPEPSTSTLAAAAVATLSWMKVRSRRRRRRGSGDPQPAVSGSDTRQG